MAARRAFARYQLERGPFVDSLPLTLHAQPRLLDVLGCTGFLCLHACSVAELAAALVVQGSDIDFAMHRPRCGVT